jgi:hypothetical protein
MNLRNIFNSEEEAWRVKKGERVRAEHGITLFCSRWHRQMEYRSEVVWPTRVDCPRGCEAESRLRATSC